VVFVDVVLVVFIVVVILNDVVPVLV